MDILTNFVDLKVIFYIHTSVFFLLYSNFAYFKCVYKSLTNAKYVISMVPFENDYLFEKWGINSVLMNNFITYDYNFVIPSDLSDNSILMLGRANDKKKRFEIGIQAMEYIIEDLPECELKIISNLTNISELKALINNYNLKNNLKLIEYTSTPEIYFRNASLHLFPSISEGFGLVLTETKIYGIPNILLGIDYVSASKGGTIIIYDDTSESLAKESIKILKNHEYKKKLGRESRKSMKKFNILYFVLILLANIKS
jgi:glycosyltransferase involved in cell wall biosynthesis